MPSNRQRRESAQRKLQRQLARRAAHTKSRRRNAFIAATLAGVLVAGGIIYLITNAKSSQTPAAKNAAPSAAASVVGTPSSLASTPVTTTSEPNPIGCVYTEQGGAAKPAVAPTVRYPATTGTVSAVMTLNGTQVPITVDRAKAPCSANAFLSLAAQKFYDGTSCHRLTHSDGLNVLQCGDPSGLGSGGPGFSYPTEGKNTPGADPIYTVGTVALANRAGLQGSQFFIVYGPMQIPTGYTVIGHIDEQGMKAVQDIASKGVHGQVQDGKPVAPAEISSITVPADAPSATTSWTPTPTPTPTVSGPVSAPSQPTSAPTSTG